MQVGKIYRDSFPSYHPHAAKAFSELTNNAIYEASNKLSLIPELKGSDNLKFHKNLILTKDGMSKSRWELPEIFRNLKISYHSPNSFKQEYFQSAAKGQEFVVQEGDLLNPWITGLLSQNAF